VSIGPNSVKLLQLCCSKYISDVDQQCITCKAYWPRKSWCLTQDSFTLAVLDSRWLIVEMVELNWLYLPEVLPECVRNRFSPTSMFKAAVSIHSGCCSLEIQYHRPLNQFPGLNHFCQFG